MARLLLTGASGGGRLKQLTKRRTGIGILYTGLVDPELAIERVVDQAANFIARVAIQSRYVAKETNGCGQGFRSGTEPIVARSLFSLQTRTFFAKPIESLPDLLLRQALLGQVDESLLTAIELTELLGRSLADHIEADLLSIQRVFDLSVDRLDELLGQQD
ncbi:hypothetical protein [Luteipulveratus mongoliensis]|uniref:Uncharacterized protein n=1 Tax=Luteipulveratus mongoliensis TaxID=571913 RepID=A0A0K1JNL3_9MICO|nr:hypothetical protein [Luteipulveratus mongoliensis]AKU18183.1 hypothetical protein VV02_23920 [Luteipulveratus mongoliensis]